MKLTPTEEKNKQKQIQFPNPVLCVHIPPLSVHFCRYSCKRKMFKNYKTILLLQQCNTYASLTPNVCKQSCLCVFILVCVSLLFLHQLVNPAWLIRAKTTGLAYIWDTLTSASALKALKANIVKKVQCILVKNYFMTFI